jgi:hypothetical protein
MRIKTKGAAAPHTASRVVDQSSAAQDEDMTAESLRHERLRLLVATIASSISPPPGLKP